MANVQKPQRFQLAANIRFQEAIAEAWLAANAQAFTEYGGRRIRFKHRWHSIYPEVELEADIADAYFDRGDDGDLYLMFEVSARDPRTWQDQSIILDRYQVEFI